MPSRNFLTLFSEDLPAARDWYVDRLGYVVDFDSDWFVQLKSPDVAAVELGILRRDHELVPPALRSTTAGCMLTVVVEDVDALHAKLQSAGDVVLEAPTDKFYGQRRMLVEGPEGVIVDVSSACDPDPEWLASLRT